ncbi:MAG: DUF2130 domain-containing protein [Mycobacterium sp.]
MAATSRVRTPDSAPTPAVCPFCGQPLLNKQAVDHLAHQEAAYEATLRRDLAAEAEAHAEVKIKEAMKSLEADAAKQLELAKRNSAKEVASLKAQLRDSQRNQDAKVRAELRKKLADEREKLELKHGRQEKQLQSTLEKVQEQNSELKRRLERLSAGDRGEFNEEEILARLVRAFPDDEIIRNGRGQRGADIFQRVRFRTDGDLVEAGLIIYECKDTSQWNNSFITQMKSEATLHHTPYSVLISRRFPRGHKNLAVIDDVVVVEPERAVALAEVMRRMVIETYRSSAMAGSQAEKTAELFSFVSSNEFRQAFDSLFEATTALQESLARERQNHLRVWTERDRHYHDIGDKIVQIDSRFKAILEAKGNGRPQPSARPRGRARRPLRPTA